MKKEALIFELTDEEIRVFCFASPSWGIHGRRFGTVEFEQIPLPAGVIVQGNLRQENILLEVLVRYRERRPAKRQKAYLAIPLQQGFMRSYTLPWLKRQDRASAISLLIDAEIAVAKTDVLYDYYVLAEKKSRRLQIILGATRRSILEQYVEIFNRAGFSLDKVDFAFAILGQALGFAPDEDVLYLNKDSASLQVVLFRGLVPERVRSLRLEGEWTSEIKRFLLLYGAQHPDFNFNRLVWSGDAEVEALSRSLLNAYPELKIEEINLKAIPDFWKRNIKAELAESRIVVGYGSRILARESGLDLWRQPKLERKKRQRFQGLALFSLMLLMICLGSGFFLKQMAMHLQEEIQKLERQRAAFGEQVEPQTDLQTAWSKVKLNPTKVGVFLAEIQALQDSADGELKIEQVSYKQDNVFLRGNTQDAQSVQNLIGNLRMMGWEQPVLSSYQIILGGRIQFSIITKSERLGALADSLKENSLADE